MLLAVFAAMTWTAVGYPGAARTFPLLVGGMGVALCLAQLVRGLRAAPHRSRPATPLRPHLVMLGWLLGAIVLVSALGVLAGSLLFLFGFLRVRERESIAWAAASAFAVALLLHVVLERGLGLVLYEGMLR
ncbi:MAG: tripartite tricarboxylate transporter TctB family protein [Acidobacteria bacterium]|nr:tripartite tricarboxylate transporter TctB family protein [Acidobacteriota bacterium]